MFGDLLMSDRSLVATCLQKTGWKRSGADPARHSHVDARRNGTLAMSSQASFECATRQEAVQTKRVRVVDLLGGPLRARLPRAINVNGCIAAWSVS